MVGGCPLPETERRYFSQDAEVRVLDAEGGRHITWYPALFHSLSEDMGGFRERIARRAFNKTLKDADVRALFNHNPDFVLGRNTSGTLDLTATDKGLRAVVNPPDTQWASDLMTSIDRGDISGGSFGFRVIKDDWRQAEVKGSMLRELLEVQLLDVSLVTYPAYLETNGLVGLRSAFADVEVDDLVLPILRSRAGAALADGDRERFERAIVQIRSSIPESPASLLGLRRRELELIRLRGREGG